MHQALTDIEKLLRAYGHTYEANVASIAAAQFGDDPVAACRSINSAEWWEDSDAVASIDLALSGGFTAESRRDAQTLRTALIDVFTTLRDYGEHNDAGQIIVAQFRKWAESRL